MAGKNWQAGGLVSIPAQVVLCLIATIVPFGGACAWSDDSPAASFIGPVDPNVVGELLIGCIVVCAFLASIALWIFSLLNKAKGSRLRRNAFISSALNNLNQGVVMTDPKQRIVFCNNRYLEIYGLTRSDVPGNMTAPELLELRRERGSVHLSAEDFYASASAPEGPRSEPSASPCSWLSSRCSCCVETGFMKGAPPSAP